MGRSVRVCAAAPALVPSERHRPSAPAGPAIATLVAGTAPPFPQPSLPSGMAAASRPPPGRLHAGVGVWPVCTVPPALGGARARTRGGPCEPRPLGFLVAARSPSLLHPCFLSHPAGSLLGAPQGPSRTRPGRAPAAHRARGSRDVGCNCGHPPLSQGRRPEPPRGRLEPRSVPGPVCAEFFLYSYIRRSKRLTKITDNKIEQI